MKRTTRFVHSGRPDPDTGLVNASVSRASTVLAPTTEELYNPKGSSHHYGRGGIGPHPQLRSALCELYQADYCALTSSGLAAVILAIRTALKGPGEALITDSVYGPVRRFCAQELPRLGVTPTFFDPRAGSGIEKLLTDKTSLIVLESPGSLTFEVQDIAAISEVAKARDIPTVIDDTWSAGVLMNPLDLGVDFAAQSLTKYVGGHSDILAGAVVSREHQAKTLKERESLYGQHVSPDDAYLALRGFRTLALRLERSGASGFELAQRLQNHPRVKNVLHPALPDHRDHALFKAQFSGSAGCFSIVLDRMGPEACEALCARLSLFGQGFSWGGFESLALPCDRQLRRSAVPWKETGALLRLSIGLEDVEDLWSDLEMALS